MTKILATAENVETYIEALEFDLHFLDNEEILAKTQDELDRINLIRYQTYRDISGARRRLKRIKAFKTIKAIFGISKK